MYMKFIKILKNTIHKKRKVLVVFDDMIADTLSNKKRNPTVTELYIRGRKLNIYLFLLHTFISLF